jgi:hypothetical protein
MRTARVLSLGLVALALAGSASAASLEQGSSLLAIQLTRGVADYAIGGSGDITTTAQNEMGVQAQYWYFLRPEYAVTLSAGIGYFRKSDTSAPGVGIGSFRETINSWQVRLGGDRFGRISDKLQVFAGPGIQVWGGRGKIETPGSESEGPTAIRFALTGRIGVAIAMTENFGLVGHLGQYWGYVSAEQGEAKTKAIPSGTEGAMGFGFGF